MRRTTKKDFLQKMEQAKTVYLVAHGTTTHTKTTKTLEDLDNTTEHNNQKQKIKKICERRTVEKITDYKITFNRDLGRVYLHLTGANKTTFYNSGDFFAVVFDYYNEDGTTYTTGCCYCID